MRIVSQYILIAVTAIVALSGCGNNKETEPDLTGRKDAPSFTATIGDDLTRAFDQTWELGDEIGISGCNRTNVCYITNNASSFRVKQSGDQIYFQDESEVIFTAYYPWNNLNAGVSVINVDTKDQTKQKTFDYLWATASGKKDAPDVSFNFTHRMTKLYLTVRPGNGMSYEELKKVRLSLKGFGLTGTFNTADGNTIAGAPAGEAWNFSELAQNNDTEQTMSFSFIFIPQVFNGPLEFLARLDIPGNDGLDLNAVIDFTNANREKDGASARNEWVAGRQYNLSITLNKTGITLNDCNINPWSKVEGEEIVVD